MRPDTPCAKHIDHDVTDCPCVWEVQREQTRELILVIEDACLLAREAGSAQAGALEEVARKLRAEEAQLTKIIREEGGDAHEAEAEAIAEEAVRIP